MLDLALGTILGGLQATRNLGSFPVDCPEVGFWDIATDLREAFLDNFRLPTILELLH
jgi:hypothetical protein